MKRKIDYYIGFVVSIILSIEYLMQYGINVKGVLIVIMIQTAFQVIYAFYNRIKKNVVKKIKN